MLVRVFRIVRLLLLLAVCVLFLLLVGRRIAKRFHRRVVERQRGANTRVVGVLWLRGAIDVTRRLREHIAILRLRIVGDRGVDGGLLDRLLDDVFRLEDSLGLFHHVYSIIGSANSIGRADKSFKFSHVTVINHSRKL